MTTRSRKSSGPQLSDFVAGMFLAGYTFEEFSGSPWVVEASITDSMAATRLWLQMHQAYDYNCARAVHTWKSR